MCFLSETADFVINKLNSHGYEAYIVGGTVRDTLMGTEPKDTDITTNALPDKTKEIFSGFHIIETGIKHGTVTVVIDGTAIEVTTFRTETVYSDGRHPDSVEFTTDVNDDLSRRDFTMNSIAYSKSTGFIDPFGGISDIEKGIICCVGVPAERFKEDSLRILRAVRFSSVLGFKIEDDTSEAMFKCKDLLKNVSAERIYSELSKTLCGKNIRQVLINYCDIFAVIIPEMAMMKNFDQHNFHHKYDLLGHTAVVTESIEPIPFLRYAALLHDIAKPLCISFDDNGVGHFYKHPSIGAHIADDIMKKLKSDNSTREKVVKLIKLHDTPIEEDERIIKKKLRSIGEDMLHYLIKLQRADTSGLADEFKDRYKHFDKLEQMISGIINSEQCFSRKDLSVNGDDMIALGYSGKEIGTALAYALDGVIEKRTENNKSALIEYIKAGKPI